MSAESNCLNLSHQLRLKSAKAIELGALHSIQTQVKIIEHQGHRFTIRMLENLQKKNLAATNTANSDTNYQAQTNERATDRPTNPFLPYEEALFVCNLSNTHLCLLNKFNVIENHFLIVTRKFEEQNNLLTGNDLAALAFCLAEIDGLAFYNGGKIAGASQRHKHLQMIPDDHFNHEGIVTPLTSQPADGCHPALNFKHQFALLRNDQGHSPSAKQLEDTYQTMITTLSIAKPGQLELTIPYNLLVTRNWMLLVPRKEETFRGIGLNALGFVGTLLVKNLDQLEILENEGPMAALKWVTFEQK